MNKIISDIYDYKIKNGLVTIFRYKGLNDRIVIPNYIEGYPVTIIEKCAFQNSNIKFVKFPYELKIVGKCAFANCKLKNVVLNQKLHIIREGAFMNTKLEEIFFPKCITNIGDNAFENCLKLEKISFGKNNNKNGYLRIQSCAFKNCNIKNVKFPFSLISIESESFANNLNLDFISFRNKLKYIGEKAFFRTKLNSLIIPDNIIRIENDAFKECDFNNMKDIIIPDKFHLNCIHVFGCIFKGNTNEEILKTFYKNYLNRKNRKSKIILFKSCYRI